MKSRKEEKKLYWKNIKKKSDEYKILLNKNKIQLINLDKEITCIKCNNKKQANFNNFYLKIIKFDGINYLPFFEHTCKNCLIEKQRQSGKLFNDKVFELKNPGLRKCVSCNEIKELNLNNFNFTLGYFGRICRICLKNKATVYIKNRRETNPEALRKNKREYQSRRRKRDPIYKMRKYVSTSVYKYLRKNNGSKNGKSVINFLPFTIEQLKIHLEQLFEWWMRWDNIGKYNTKTWNDNDPSTWKWQLNHIIPQSYFPYSSMSDDNFKKCWSLSNLRPYSAKQNVLEGNRKMSVNG